MSLPPGVHVKNAQVATQGGEGDWYSYEGDIKFENVMVVDEVNNKVRTNLEVYWLLLKQPFTQILLGLKKEGFGEGNYNPFAGPIGEEENGLDAARRDLLVWIIICYLCIPSNNPFVGTDRTRS